MNAKVLILPFVVLTACSGPRGCSGDRTQAPNQSSGQVSPAQEDLSAPAATPDPLAGRRSQTLARVDKLPDSECDILVLQFQLIPRDEVIEPLSSPRKELLRFVRRIATAEDLDAIDGAIEERKRPSAEELDAIRRTKK